MKRHLQSRAWAPWIAAAVAAAVLAAPLLAGLSYHGWDLTANDMGYLCELKRRLAAGEPLWLSPLIGNGSPLLIDPAAQLFYPPRWLSLWLPIELGTSWIVVFHVAVAAGATTWLARGYGVRPYPAIGAGLACALSGIVLDTTIHSVYAISASWQALAWAAGRHLARRPRDRRLFVVASLALAASLLGGEPQSFGIGCALVLGEALCARRAPWRSRAARLALASGAAGIAFAGVSALWLPALAELALTPRFASLTSGLATLCSFRSEYWIGVIAPGIFTEPLLSGRYLWELLTETGGSGIEGDLWNRTPYLGPLFLTLALTGVSRRRTALVAVVAGGGLLLALGDQTPLFGWAAAVFPPLGYFRYPAKYLVVVAIAAAVLLGRGLQGVARDGPLRRRWRIAAAVALTGLSVAIAATLVARRWLDGIDEIGAAAPLAEGGRSLSALLATGLAQGAAPLAAALALSLLLAGRRRGIALLVALDLGLAATGELGLGAGLASLRSPLARAVADTAAPAVLCHHPDLARRRLTIPGTSIDWSTLALRRLLALPNLNTCDGLATGFGYTVFASAQQLRLQKALGAGLPAAAHALGCTHLVTLYPTADQTARQIELPEFTGGDTLGNALRLYALGDLLAPAFALRRPQWHVDDDSVYAHVVSSTAVDQIVRAVDDPIGRQPPPALPDGAAVGELTVDWPRRDRARVVASGRGGAVIGLRTLFLRGWTARQAGRALPTVRSGGNFAAAVVDDVAAGPIEFEYRPPRLAVGIALSAAGWLALLALVVFWRRIFAR
ncbi:MAG: hypothetical protein JXR83_18480 [Deltaproteobacteria bacterium]|nr:hypothetical protein [Deltaproteobacteria bacterium]